MLDLFGTGWFADASTWNRIARILADQERLNVWDVARLFALVGLGQFDAYAPNLDSKYFYNL